MTTRSRRRLGASLAIAMAISAPTAAAGILVPLGPQAWQSTHENGFAVTSATTLRAPAGSYAAGASGGFSWCTPYRATSIQRATFKAYRYHQTPSTARVEVGPRTDGSLGPSYVESTIPAGSGGFEIPVESLASSCVGARMRQTGAQQNSTQRIWDLVLANVVLSDDQGPTVDNLRLEGPQAAGWFTGPITVVWSGSDNDLLRGTTGATILNGGQTVDRGDAADGVELRSTLDPGADGPHIVRAVRNGGGGWPVADRVIETKVDRNAPSIPVLSAAPTARGTAPIALSPTGSIDPPGGSGLTRYELTTDGGRTILQSASLTRVGRYDVRARAVDIAGNASAWSLPIQVEVTGTQPGQPAASETPTAEPPAAGGGLPDLTGVTLARLGATRPRVKVRARTYVQLRPIWGARSIVVGRFVGADRKGLNGATVVARTPTGETVGQTTTNPAGKFRLKFKGTVTGTYSIAVLGQPEVIGRAYVVVRPRIRLDRRIVSIRRGIGRTVALRPGRIIVVSGRAAPKRLVANRLAQLEYLGNGQWQSLGSPTAIDRRGRWKVRYALARPGRALVQMRVVVRGQRGLGFALGRTPRFSIEVR
jgi:hypothetical protein